MSDTCAILVGMSFTYTISPTGTVYGLYNELGEIVFSGGLLECHELQGRYGRLAEMVRDRKPFTGSAR